MPSSLLACMDYCNSILYGLPKRLIQRLQRIQNTAARLVTRSNRDDHITPVLKSLHWLPVHLQGTAAHVQNNPWQRAIIFIRVSFKLHSKQKPSLIIKKPSLSAQDETLTVRRQKFWNELPDSVRKCESLDVFKSALKKHLSCNTHL